MVWQIQEAKQRFSEFVQKALDEGPQTVSRRGRDVAVLVSARDFERLAGHRLDFKDFLLTAPDLQELDIERPRDLPRAVDL
ncbi:MAG: type II toxin-antitoxin system Phd/YefM family antitoxin [Chloroflexi bacterium]|nr:type II toxin-antitoxin system Phd/YefM family antitoxin [Betaproteobacteria bacterium]MBI4213035.1 type II toxin-antitoxin system Phd/YefM family antitoxin [Chloroflexota bacterium]